MTMNNNYKIQVKKAMTDESTELHDEIKVAIEIEKMVSNDDLTYIEAICHYYDINGIDVEEAPKYIHKNIQEKLKLEVQKLKLISGEEKAKLPF